MFRKKQTPQQTGRTVRQQQTANVFSYYASRSPGTMGQSGRQMVAPEKPASKRRASRLTFSKWLAYTPTMVAGFVLLLCLVYVSTLSSDPKLQVVGDQRDTGLIAGIDVYEAGMRDVFDNSITNRSKLLIDTDGLAQQLQEKFPELGDVAVILPLVGRRPVVQVQPARPALVLGTVEGGLVIGENGRTIAEAREVDSSVRDPLPQLQDESGLSLERGGYALPAQTVSFIRDVAAQLAKMKYEVQSMVLPTSPNEMHLRLKDAPYYVKFDLRGDSRVQAGTFIATKEKLEADKVTPREYIDVRVPGKAYYK